MGGNNEGPSGIHGQNILICVPSCSLSRCVEYWYEQLYDLKKVDLARDGLQMVWKATKYVGMALSEDGNYFVANYFPKMEGNLRSNFSTRKDKYSSLLPQPFSRMH